MEVSQCGVRVETSGSCNKLMMIPSKPNTHPRRSIRWNRARRAGFAFVFFFVVASTSARTRPPANMAPVVAMERYEPVAKARSEHEDFNCNDQCHAHQHKRQADADSKCR